MAIRFDNAADSLTRGTSLPTLAGGWTFMCWANRAVTGAGYQTVISFQETSGHYAVLYMGRTSATTTFVLTDGSSDVDGSAGITNGTWYHLAMTGSNSPNPLLAYVNGVLDMSHSVNSLLDAPDQFQIGQTKNGDEEWNGRVAALKIYNAVLPAADIALEMRQYLPIRTANLNSWYPLFSTAEATVDYSGAGLSLTANGTLATEDGPPIPWDVGRHRMLGAGAPPAPEVGYVLVAN